MSIDLNFQLDPAAERSPAAKRKTPSPTSSLDLSFSPALSADSPSSKKLCLTDQSPEDLKNEDLTPSSIHDIPARMGLISPTSFPGQPKTGRPQLGKPLPQLTLSTDSPLAPEPFHRPSSFTRLSLTLPLVPPSLEVQSRGEEKPDIQILPFEMDSEKPAETSAPAPKGHQFHLKYFQSRCLLGTPELQKKVVTFLEEQQIVLNRVVASGANGVTFEGMKNGIPVICKVLFHPHPIAANRGNHLLQNLSHPSLIQIKGICNSGNQLLGILMEKAEGRTLKNLALDPARKFLAQQRIGSLSHSSPHRTREITPRQFFSIAAKIASGLKFLKAHGLLHRDIQPNNILVDDAGNVKIIDFDLLRKADGTCTEIVGVESFQAPEMPWILPGASYSYPVDAYSFGKVLSRLISKVNWAGLEHLEEPAEKFIKGLMKQEPDERTEIGLAYEQLLKLEPEASL